MGGRSGRPRVGIVSDEALHRQRLQTALAHTGLDPGFTGDPAGCWPVRNFRKWICGW